jgi:hypothetical protein
MVFEEKRQFVLPKFGKNAEVGDHDIGPRANDPFDVLSENDGAN